LRYQPVLGFRSNNQITDNQIQGNHWGILINTPSVDATGNLIRGNTISANGRAGIGILGTASGNTVENNNAAGNGLLNLAPSFRFDLFAASPLANIWRNNQGTPNFGVASVTSPPDSRWDTDVPIPLAWGYTIMQTRNSLRREVERVLTPAGGGTARQPGRPLAGHFPQVRMKAFNSFASSKHRAS
jgi:parallel beta-helix repeat protein